MEQDMDRAMSKRSVKRSSDKEGKRTEAKYQGAYRPEEECEGYALGDRLCPVRP